MLYLTNRKQYSTLYTLKDPKNGVKIFKTQVKPSFKDYTEYEMIDGKTDKETNWGYNHLISKKCKQKTFCSRLFQKLINPLLPHHVLVKIQVYTCFVLTPRTLFFLFSKNLFLFYSKSKLIKV